MFRSVIKQLNHSCFRRNFSITKPNNNEVVTIVGAAGVVGQLITFLLKMNEWNERISELRIHDLKNIAGVYADVSHIDTKLEVITYEGKENLKYAVYNASVVIVTAGSSIVLQDHEKLFQLNAPIIYDITKVVRTHAPNALMTILTNPINSLVPVAEEVAQTFADYGPGRIFGLTHMDVVRARAFMRHAYPKDSLEYKKMTIPVIGGHTEDTIIPLISYGQPYFFDEDTKDIYATKRMYNRIRKSNTEFFKLHGRSACLSAAYATAQFVGKLCQAIDGEENILVTAYVKSTVVPELGYFASPLHLGTTGIKLELSLPIMNSYENEFYKKAKKVLKKHIELGREYAEKRLEKEEKEKNEVCKKEQN